MINTYLESKKKTKENRVPSLETFVEVLDKLIESSIPIARFEVVDGAFVFQELELVDDMLLDIVEEHLLERVQLEGDVDVDADESRASHFYATNSVEHGANRANRLNEKLMNPCSPVEELLAFFYF